MNYRLFKMKSTLLLFSFILLVGFWSCTDTSTIGSEIDPTLKITKDLVIPNSFSFLTSKEVSVGILIKNSSSVLTGVPVLIYFDYPGSSVSPILNARLAGTYTSGSDGRIDIRITVPGSQDSLYLKTSYIGIESEAGFSIIGNSASYKYGEGNTIKSAPLNQQSKAAFTYSFLGSYTTQGTPNYLEPIRDKITQGLLDSINASLPEFKRLPDSHPQYLTAGNESNLVFKEQCDVWVTFVSEGASYLNSLGYYTYDALNPPKSQSDIKKYTMIFPNASLGGSGGAMKSGDKVKLGRFEAGKAIGWFLVANGWNSNSVSAAPTYFSDPVLNPESKLEKRQHTVLLYNNLRKLLLLSFEDQSRNTASSSDEDFNDAIFYVTANPVEAIDVTKVPSIDTPTDDDKDGVSNNFDEFPKDPKRAYTNYYPAKDQFNSLLVEDLWPSLGDFDFNDMVIDCQYKQVTDAKSSVVELFIKLKVRAIGASYKNGFGIQFPVAASAVSSVILTDQSGTAKSIGVESGQDKAVVIAFENAFQLLPSTGGAGVNVIPGNGWSEPKEIELHVLFATPQLAENLGTAPYNPFVFVNSDRMKEIHLANATPTGKASATFFGLSDDTSDPATSRYYKSKNNLIWMMEVPSSFAYAVEKKDILKAYLKFGAWAESGGSLFKDWYMDKPGYRENSLIYSK